MTAASGDIVGPRGGVVLVSSTAYTWRAEANGLTLVFIAGSAITFTAPVGLPIGMTSKVIQQGTGTITFAAGSGVALNSATGMFTPSAQYAGVTLGSVGVDSYILSGEVSGSGGGGLTVNPSVTPHPGGGQASAVQLSVGVTGVLPPASTGDSLQLPLATAGSIVVLIPGNFASNEANVYVKNGSSDTVNGINDFVDFGITTAGGAPFPVLWFICPVDGDWRTNGVLD
jgi:hypothetical protein